MTSLEFRLLGPLDVQVEGAAVPIRGARQQVVLAVLLLEANRVVPVERLIEAVWADAPPTTARSQIQMAVSDLRKRFADYVDTPFITSHPAGYSATVAAEALDVHRFDQQVAAGRDAVRRGDIAAGADHLRRALGVWRGEAVSGLVSRVVESAALRLNEQRLSVLEECIGLELRLGLHHEVIGELRELVQVYPLREGLHAHLMLALYRAGRQAEALEAFRSAHRVLADEHGLDPGEQLTSLERAILTNDPALNRPDTADAEAPTVRQVPRQLPAAVPDFVGREDVIADLRGRLSRAADAESRGVEVIVISGAGGMGKTALAVHLAHLVSDQFPDGQLFARLNGVDAQPVRAKQILQEFLRSLGVLPAALPETQEELAKEFRSRLAGAQVMVVLDDAATVEQVVPLIPGDAGCVVIVTSRRSLSGLSGAHRVDLGVLDEDASLNLLAHVIGGERVAEEAESAKQLAEACGYLPLALRIAAAKLSVRRHWGVDRMLRRLRDERVRLDELALEGVGVRASISYSYHALSEQARQLLRMLSLLGATDFSDWVGAPLLEVDPDDASDNLQELYEASLVVVDKFVGRQVRYRVHDLVRIFAQEALAREVPRQQRLDAQVRMLRCWLHLAREAHTRATGGDFAVMHSDAELWELPDAAAAELVAEPIQWFAMEHVNLVSAVELAAQIGQTRLCWDLAITSVTLFEARSYTDSWREVTEIAMDACRDSEDRRGEAVMHYSNGELALFEDRLDDAEREFHVAGAYFRETEDTHGRGLTMRNLGFIDRMRGQPQAALAHNARALVDLRAVGDRSSEANVLSSMAQAHLDMGEVEHAERYLNDAAAISQELGSLRGEAQIRHRLGNLHLAQGRLAEAEREFRSVLDAVNSIGDLVGSVYGKLGVGLVNIARGEPAAAQAILREAREAADDTGDQLSIGRVLLAQARASTQEGDRATATARLREAKSVFTEAGAAAWLERAQELEHELVKEEGDS